MKYRNLTLICLLCFFPLFSNASEQFSQDQVTTILKEKSVEIGIIGSLKFCKKDGLARTLLIKTTGSILSNLVSAKETNAMVKLDQVVNAIDINTVGIATGLKLANMSTTSNENYCSMVIEVTDELLANKTPSAGP